MRLRFPFADPEPGRSSAGVLRHLSSHAALRATLCGVLAGTALCGVNTASPAFAQAAATTAATTGTATSLPAGAAPAPVLAADAVQEAFVRVANRVKPSVVNIYAEKRAAPTAARPSAPRPGQKPPQPRIVPRPDEGDEDGPFSPSDPRERRVSLGTGMVVRADGYVLTNYHVVKGASLVRVLFNADSERPDRPVARLVAFDEESDLALLKVARTNLQAIEFADSDTVRIGEWAIAVGAPFEQAQTVTVGVISAKGRHLPNDGQLSLQDYIQTDASINPGNSGGPLINLEGRVIGINTAILSPSRYNVGIGFSVPSNTIRAYLPTLMEGRKIARGFLGINYERIDPEVAREFGVSDGIQVGRLASDDEGRPIGPARQAGLQEGDIITAVDGTAIDSSDVFRRLVSNAPPGRKITLAVVRPAGERIERLDMAVTLGDWALQNRALTPDTGPTPPNVPASRLGLEVIDARELTEQERALFKFEERPRGVIIRDVVSGSPADEADLSRGLILVRVRVAGGAWQPVPNKAAFERIQKSLAPGARVLMQLRNSADVSSYKVVITPA